MAGSWPSQQEVDAYVTQQAPKYGIQTDVAIGIRRGESQSGYVGDYGSSFGPFQLHYGGIASGKNAGNGLGNVFSNQTGLDARDPSTWKQQIDWSLAYASHNGWGSWSAATRLGYGIWDGIRNAVDPSQVGAAISGTANQITNSVYDSVNGYVQNRAATLLLLGIGIFLTLVGLYRMASSNPTVQAGVSAAADVLPAVMAA